MGNKKLHQLLIPVIQGYQKWVSELASLALTFAEEEDDEDEAEGV